MTRFFIPTTQLQGNTVSLSGSDQHHLLQVLRKKIGDEFTVLTGTGHEYRARITGITPVLTAELVGEIERPVEPRVKINLIQSLPKADKFEYILQKNTELGVSSFQPVISERSLIKLDGGVIEKKWERWQKIIKEAAEQAGRRILPELSKPLLWQPTLDRLQSELILIPWEGETENSLKKVLSSQPDSITKVSVIIGPEGGFSLKEVEQARQAGAVPVTLGPRILRTETAGLVVATAILYHLADLE